MTATTITLIKQTETWTEYRIESPEFGLFKCWRHDPKDGHSNHPKGRPWHLTTTGMYFDSPESAAAYLDSQDWSEPASTPARHDDANARMIDAGWQAYTREEGHYDIPDCY